MSDVATARDSSGNRRELQRRNPIIQPEGAKDDCAYCAYKSECSKTRDFFVGESNPPCARYINNVEKMTKDAERHSRLTRLKEVKVPVVRPEGEAKDCLYCKLLKESARCCYPYPHQGEGRVCGRYNEVNVRPEGEPQHCIYCLDNYNCSAYRIKHDGKPCKRYEEA